ncbi:MAG TPA: hypothetical protein VK712_00285 [Verrucomicrobiae bacterium]|jgi:hypothetical protein|nr:hypothetical protein [Verrucomicrobiae bacterium]
MNTSTIKQICSNRIGLVVATVIGIIAMTALRAGAISQATTSASTTTAAQANLQLVINVGNGEIQRRLTTLGNLTSGVDAAQYLAASDKSSLSSEISTETSALTALQTKLDAETTVAGAATDDSNVITEYRVYVLVVPKVYIVIAADNQQVTEGVLSNMATGFQGVITADQKAGKNVTSLQSELSDLNGQVAAAKAISSAMETSVVGLQPTDYNSDHTLLVGDYTKLQTAQSDNGTAINDANQLLTGLQSL